MLTSKYNAAGLGNGFKTILAQKTWNQELKDRNATVFDMLRQFFIDLRDGKVVYELNDYAFIFKNCNTVDGRKTTEINLGGFNYKIQERVEDGNYKVVFEDSLGEKFELHGFSFDDLDEAMELNSSKIKKLEWKAVFPSLNFNFVSHKVDPMFRESADAEQMDSYF